MASDVGDFKLASTAAGFTLGFGVICVWNAIQQTRSVRSPLRSVYIYMVWGEIVANLIIAIIAWLFLDGTLKPGVPVFFSILFLWVFEVQLLMQIIINRIAIVVDDWRLIRNMKWGTALIITCINIAVFIIWIPAHLVPPPIPVMVIINKYWDRTSKFLIMFVDAGLNYFFLLTVKRRLVKYHGLTKYAPLVRFNARLMVLSVSMDLMLICLMSLKNQVVYIQFHPVAYMVKLNIELSMASLITKLARGTVEDRNNEFMVQSSSHNHSQLHSTSRPTAISMKSGVHSSATGKPAPPSKEFDDDLDRDLRNLGGIRTLKEVNIRVENIREEEGESGSVSGVDEADGFDRRKGPTNRAGSDDELPLHHPGVPSKGGEGW